MLLEHLTIFGEGPVRLRCKVLQSLMLAHERDFHSRRVDAPAVVEVHDARRGPCLDLVECPVHTARLYLDFRASDIADDSGNE